MKIHIQYYSNKWFLFLHYLYEIQTMIYITPGFMLSWTTINLNATGMFIWSTINAEPKNKHEHRNQKYKHKRTRWSRSRQILILTFSVISEKDLLWYSYCTCIYYSTLLLNKLTVQYIHLSDNTNPLIHCHHSRKYVLTFGKISVPKPDRRYCSRYDT